LGSLIVVALCYCTVGGLSVFLIFMNVPGSEAGNTNKFILAMIGFVFWVVTYFVLAFLVWPEDTPDGNGRYWQRSPN